MSYALSVAPNAQTAILTLDIEAQESILDLLDQLALEGPELDSGEHRHFVSVSTPVAQTHALLWLEASHITRRLHLSAVWAVVV
jgi:hypothetical protein